MRLKLPGLKGLEKLKYEGGWKCLKICFSPGKKKKKSMGKKNPMVEEKRRGRENYLQFPNRFTG